MKNKTLVIMAGGLGSRFGSLKQVEVIGPSGEFIIDYSIYDAIKAGFNKVIFIIKEEYHEIFEKSVGKRIKNHIKVEYAFQSTKDVPREYSYLNREKPWGTSHAILSCRKIVKEEFVVINADDFYGRETFEIASKFIDENKDSNTFAMIGYKVNNTIGLNGVVKRGVAYEKNGFLTKIVESSIEKKGKKIIASPLNGKEPFEVEETNLVSMNFFVFNPLIIDCLEKKFPIFLKTNLNNIDKCEYLIPESIYEGIKEKKFKMKVLNTNSKWYGVTYKEDKEEVVNAINNMIKENIYPKKLW